MHFYISLLNRGLECALWPHLYWHRNLCETVARLSHQERQHRLRAAARGSDDLAVADEDSEVSSSDEEEDGPKLDNNHKLGRIKRSFLRKVLSPVVGYGSDYDLLHFMYDLSMWTTVGSKKNVAKHHDVPLRLVLKGCPWTPQYWRIRHLAVIDMQRQCGNATLFRTRAPYEKSFPYHEWIMHEQRLSGKPRLHLAGPETLHFAHVLMELDKGYFSGSRGTSGRSDRTWKDHLFAAPPLPEDGGLPASTVVSRVTRLEFQDGKRKLAKQAYHGRGTVHSHSLDFLKNVARILLEEKMSAHLPDRSAHPLLHGLVLDGQCDRTNSGLPVREEESVWDPASAKVLLQHTEDDKDLKIRPYFPTTMEVTKCHEDVQQGDGNGAVLRYVSTYSLKFSDSMDQCWLSDEASDYSVARRILFSYHPLEPEMWLTLAAERFPQVDHQGTLVDIHVPLPDVETKPKWLQNYEASPWRSESMCLLDYLRKSNQDGNVIRYIRQSYDREVQDAIKDALLKHGHGTQEAQRVADSLLKAYRQHSKEHGKNVDAAGTLAAFVDAKLRLQVPDLDSYANAFTPSGQKLVAASMYSMHNDRYYGQWVVLHTPFRTLADLQAPVAEELAKAPVWGRKNAKHKR